MTIESRRIPPGPEEKYSTNPELLTWMEENFKRFGDIYKASIDGNSVYVIRDPAYAEHVLRQNWQNYVKGQAIKRVALLLGKGLMVSEGEFWKGQRRMVQPSFHSHAIAGLIGTIANANAALLASWEQSAHRNELINVTSDISHMVLNVTLRAIFGQDTEQVQPQFEILSDEAVRSLGFAQSFRSLRQIVLDIVKRRRTEAAVSADIIGMLLQARNRDTGHGMPDQQVVNEVMTLVVAGHETTASTLNWVWYLLSQHPGVECKLWTELSDLPANEVPSLEDLPKFTYTRRVVEEALRLYPAGWLMTRRALKDDQIGDYFVPAGTEIYIPLYFIQRHPDLWEHPDRFNPERFAPERLKERHRMAMLPFSAGPRNCVGEALARVEMQIHLMTIASRLRLRYVERNPPELDIGVNLRSKHSLIMAAEIRTREENFATTRS